LQCISNVLVCSSLTIFWTHLEVETLVVGLPFCRLYSVQLRSSCTVLSSAGPPKKAITRFRSTPISEMLLGLFLQYNKPDSEDQQDKNLGLPSLATIGCRIAVAVGYSSTWHRTLAKIVLHQILHHHLPLPHCVSLCAFEWRIKSYSTFYHQLEVKSLIFCLADLKLEANHSLLDFDENFIA
jgi:hypothetical protein